MDQKVHDYLEKIIKIIKKRKFKYLTHDKEQLDANMELFQLLLLFFGNFWVSWFFGPDTIKHVIHEVSKKSNIYNLKKYNENTLDKFT